MATGLHLENSAGVKVEVLPAVYVTGSIGMPTNTTTGDLTATRIKVGNGAFGTGVDFSVTGDGALSGFLGVGSETAPANTTAGDLTAIRLHLGTDAAFTAGYSLELQAARVFIAGALSGIAVAIQPTITAAGDTTQIGLVLNPTINGSGTNPAALYGAPTFAPSASIAAAQGLRYLPTFSPPAGVTITQAFAAQVTIRTGSTAGAITTAFAQYISASYGTLKPGTAYGIYLDNMGSASITTAIAIQIIKPTGATNNFYFGFDTADATAAGAYFGRLPVNYAGALKYLHVFSA